MYNFCNSSVNVYEKRLKKEGRKKIYSLCLTHLARQSLFQKLGSCIYRQNYRLIRISRSGEPRKIYPLCRMH